jgi:putative N6-adenine-specific DNA methylase
MTAERKNMLDCFAVSPPGLEPFTAAEIASLFDPEKQAGDAAPGRKFLVQTGGVSFRSGEYGLIKANLMLRTASRVLVRLGHFYASGLAELRRKAGKLEWERFIAPGAPLSFRISCTKSAVYHTQAAAERIAAAVGDRLGGSPDVMKPDEDPDEAGPQLVVVRFFRDRCMVSMDSSGPLLSRRGYRLASAKAPIRENLAAGMILASGWDRVSPLLDPFCGSGTIVIEAALLASNRAPGLSRPFAFMKWPGYREPLYLQIVRELEEKKLDACPAIHASDRDEGAIQSARENAERAGVSEFIHFERKALSEVQPPASAGWMITNPPYGRRLKQSRDLRNLYGSLGNLARERFRGWSLVLLSADPVLAGQARLPFNRGVVLDNGGIKVRLLHAAL